jgi:hypothetical protein
MNQIPRGIYKHYKNTDTHTITFYTETKTYSLSCDSLLGLLSLVDSFFSPRPDMSLSEYTLALESSLDNTVKLNKVA